MDEPDIIDDVNALLSMGVGDAYRLEHIKQSYIQNKAIWITDQRYLENMRKKYLVKRKDEESVEDEEEFIHCWKCGKKSGLGANFCMVCGAALYEVATESEAERPPVPHKRRDIGWKIPVIVGIPLIILVIAGGAYSQGYFERGEPSGVPDVPDTPDVSDADTGNSRCGPGTVFDEEANTCVLAGPGQSSDGTPADTGNSKCGPGTVFDEEANSCVLDR